MTRFGLAVLAYLVPTFALGFVWHLVLFEHAYKALAIYRAGIIIPFGILSMLIQGTIFAWIFDKAFVPRASGWPACARHRRSNGSDQRIAFILTFCDPDPQRKS